MSDMTEARVRAILDGCEGVTPGPWTYGAQWLGAKWPRDTDYIYLAQVPLNDYDSPRWNTDAAHLARLDPDTVRALCTLALSAIASRQPVVRKLEWSELRKGIGGQFTTAEIPFGRYRVTQGEKHCRLYFSDGFIGTFDGLEQAQAAAQADYTQRILSALTKPEDSQ
jgi:hypothetical protein